MFRSTYRRFAVTLAASSLAMGIAALPAAAATQQSGLVNVALTGNTVQVPVAVAANICDVQANVIASNNFGGNGLCTSTSHATATGGGGGGGGSTSQQGLVNVALTGNTVQVPIGIAANVCDVQANVLAAGNFGGNGLCTSATRAAAL